jgi:hypothetical protein
LIPGFGQFFAVIFKVRDLSWVLALGANDDLRLTHSIRF